LKKVTMPGISLGGKGACADMAAINGQVNAGFGYALPEGR